MALQDFIVVGPDDPRWQAAFDRLPIARQDVFWTPAYARLMQATLYREHQVLCAIGEPDPLLYPFVLRCCHPADMTGMYGRSGAICGAVLAPNWESFFDGIDRFARNHGVVTLFDRYHPVIGNTGPATFIREIGDFIVLDLSPPIEEIERRYAHSLRKEIAKAERAGVSTVMTRGAVSTFGRIYDDTMDRRSAEKFYRFNGWFFERAEALLGDLAVTFFAKSPDDHFASCELCLVHGLYAHSFLGGTTEEGLALSANHILKRDLIRELKRRGCRWYLLGGGAKPGDGIERYKRQFAPDGVYPSRIGCRIFDQERYDRLKADMLAAGLPIRPERFQFYDPS